MNIRPRPLLAGAVHISRRRPRDHGRQPARRWWTSVLRKCLQCGHSWVTVSGPWRSGELAEKPLGPMPCTRCQNPEWPAQKAL